MPTHWSYSIAGDDALHLAAVPRHTVTIEMVSGMGVDVCNGIDRKRIGPRLLPCGTGQNCGTLPKGIGFITCSCGGSVTWRR